MPNFVHKVVQIHETQLVRHGMMIVGETGCGKSTALQTLSGALTSLKESGEKDADGLYERVTIHSLNPKSLPLGGLYGSVR